MWKKILLKILNGEKEIPSPFSKDGVMKFVFVMVDFENRLGFLWIWCSDTHKGVNISRLGIPEGVEFVTDAEFAKMKLPIIEFEDPSR